MIDRLIAPENADIPRTRDASSGVFSAMRACPVGGIAATAEPKTGPRASRMIEAVKTVPAIPAARRATTPENNVPAMNARKRAVSRTRLRPHAIERRPQNWLSIATPTAASDTAAPTIHSGILIALARGAIDTLSMFCAVYVNRAIASSARSVGWASTDEVPVLLVDEAATTFSISSSGSGTGQVYAVPFIFPIGCHTLGGGR